MKFNILNIESLASTNQYLFDIVSNNNATEGLVINTENQINGKGQGNNKWESEAGKNLSFSLLLAPYFLAADKQFVITQIVSISILNICEKYLPDSTIRIKWPNDIYVNDKKIAGILIQNIIKGNSISNSVVGIGLNVNQSVFISDAPNPISIIQLTGVDLDREKILKEILGEIEKNYSRLMAYPQTKWLNDNYIKHLYRFDQDCSFTDNNGSFTGRITGVNKFGQLEILKSNGEQPSYGYKEVEFMI